MSSVSNIVKKLCESRVQETTGTAEYICKKVLCDNKGVIEILCYDTVEDEEFTKYIGQVEDPSARKNARLLLRDWKFEVPKDVKNELIGSFGLEDFGYSIEESNKEALSVDDMRDELVKYGDYTRSEVSKMKGLEVAQAWSALPRDIKESNTVRMEFATDSEAYEWAEENGYTVDKIQNGTGSKSCICWMRKIEEATTTNDKIQGWEYWEMPSNYKGPWEHDHFSKDYGKGVIGFIYPPYEAKRSWLKDMTHDDYIAELYDNNAGKEFDVEHFTKMKDARAWLDELAEYTLNHK